MIYMAALHRTFADERANLLALFNGVFLAGVAAARLSSAQQRHQRRIAVQRAMLKTEDFL
jgi:hypothetical protein